MEVTVAICKDRKCKKYVIVSDKLSVQYVCNDNYFVEEKLDKAFEKDGFKTSDSELNRFEFTNECFEPVIGISEFIFDKP